mgnify:CR=1 FL=1
MARRSATRSGPPGTEGRWSLIHGPADAAESGAAPTETEKRLALARSVYKMPALLVLDHAPLALARHIDLGAGQLDDSLSVSGDAASLRTRAVYDQATAITGMRISGKMSVGVRRAARGPTIRSRSASTTNV